MQNGHLATVEMKPDPEMAAREKKAEEDSLAAAKVGMSEANPDPRPLIFRPIPSPSPGRSPTKAGMREANPNPSPLIFSPIPSPSPGRSPTKAGMSEANPDPSPLIFSPIPIPNPGPSPTKAGMSEAQLQAVIDATASLKTAQVP